MSHPLDISHMDDVIAASPKQFAAGYAVQATAPLPQGPFTRIVVAGMGGSWMAAQLVADLGWSTIPVRIHRSYGLPHLFGGTTLLLASSYSGNTEETLSAYEEARKAGHAVVAMAAGGTLEQWCARDTVPFLKIPAHPPTMQPRSATGYGVGSVTRLLSDLGIAAPGAADAIASLDASLAGRMTDLRKNGEALALALKDATPVVYAPEQFRTVARIWKIKVNENAKTPAFWNVFPELNHNELVGWTTPHGPFHILILNDPDTHPRIRKRIEITAALLRDRGIPATIIPIEGRTQHEKTFSTLLVGDWLSYRLALEGQLDPSPVAMVEDLKRRLAS